MSQAVPVSLFQTDVPDFYVKLGGRVIDNPVINSVSDAKPQWSSHLMLYPANANWPTGTVDLLGAGW